MKKAKRIYYIARSTAGAFGGNGKTERLPERYTKKSDAVAERKKLNKIKQSHRIIYWDDFYWE